MGDRRSAILLGLAALVSLLSCLTATAAAADEVDVIAVVKSPETVSLAVDLVRSTSGPVPPESFSVAVGGAAQPARARPVMSDRLAVALVVDASEQGAKYLQAGLSGAANFVLGAPMSTRTALVVDTTQPSVVVPLSTGPSQLLRVLNDVHAGGGRNTSEAVTMALRQLPAGPDDSRVVLLYTSAPDAGGEPAAALAERVGRADALLTVISTSPDTRYWSQATAATGGLLVSDPGTLTAFDLVDRTLRSRYLVRFPLPQQLPAQVTVRVDTQQGPLAASAVVPAGEPVAAQAPPRGGGQTSWPLAIAGVAFLVTAASAFLAFRSRTRTAAPALVPAAPYGYPPQARPAAPPAPAAQPATAVAPAAQPAAPAVPAPSAPSAPAASAAEGAPVTDDDTLTQQLAVWQAWARKSGRDSAVDPLAALAANQRLTSLLASRQFHAVRAARAAGASWQQIAEILHVTPEQARADYRSDVELFRREAPHADISTYRAVLD